MTRVRALVYDASGALVADHGYTAASERQGRRHLRPEDARVHEASVEALARRARRRRRLLLAVANAAAVVTGAVLIPFPS